MKKKKKTGLVSAACFGMVMPGDGVGVHQLGSSHSRWFPVLPPLSMDFAYFVPTCEVTLSNTYHGLSFTSLIHNNYNKRKDRTLSFTQKLNNILLNRSKVKKNHNEN